MALLRGRCALHFSVRYRSRLCECSITALFELLPATTWAKVVATQRSRSVFHRLDARAETLPGFAQVVDRPDRIAHGLHARSTHAGWALLVFVGVERGRAGVERRERAQQLQRGPAPLLRLDLMGRPLHPHRRDQERLPSLQPL